MARVCPGRPFSICKERGECFGLRPAAHRSALRPRASYSPMICMGSNGRITPKAWDYSAEPPSHWTSHSHGNPALRASNMAGDELRLLSLLVDRFTGCPIPRFRRQATRLRDSDDRETNTVSRHQNSAILLSSHELGTKNKGAQLVLIRLTQEMPTPLRWMSWITTRRCALGGR
jgi:hypothetical protein